LEKIIINQLTSHQSLHFNRHFPGGSQLAGSTRRSPFRNLLELRLMEMMVTTGAIKRCKAQSNRHHQKNNPQLFTGMPFLTPNQQCQST